MCGVSINHLLTLSRILLPVGFHLPPSLGTVRSEEAFSVMHEAEGRMQTLIRLILRHKLLLPLLILYSSFSIRCSKQWKNHQGLSIEQLNSKFTGRARKRKRAFRAKEENTDVKWE